MFAIELLLSILHIVKTKKKKKTSIGFLDFFLDFIKINPKNLYRFLKTSRGFLDFFRLYKNKS